MKTFYIPLSGTCYGVTFSCQRSTKHSIIWVGSAPRVSAEQSLGVEGALGIADQHPADGDGRLARVVRDRGL